MTQKTITINGTVYDAHTGLPLGKAEPRELHAASEQAKQTITRADYAQQNSSSIHQKAQKSQTLNRRIVKKQTRSVQGVTHHKSVHITKFAPHPAGIKQQAESEQPEPVVVHPSVQKAHRAAAQKHSVKRSPQPAAAIKEQAVAAALHHAPSHAKAGQKQHKTKPSPSSRRLSIASASLALFLLGGYFTYLNMPNLSVRVAAAQAGIDASYPSYKPDGYSLNGPVAYDKGEVRMTFAANAGSTADFTITQKQTGWDSSAVKESVAQKEWGDDVTQYTEQGLTIYTHGSEAAWVNGGILYTITGDAPLSATQIRGIATSM